MARAITSLIALTLIATTGFCQSTRIAITSPADGKLVPWRLCVQGTVSDPTARVWVVIHPIEVGDFWVQQAVTVRRDGRWKVLGYIARQKARVYAGKFFEIRAIANPKQPLQETGNVPLSAWPEGDAISDVVEVTRDANASSGCGEPAQLNGLKPVQPASEDHIRSDYSDTSQPKRYRTEERSGILVPERVHRFGDSVSIWTAAKLILALFWLVLAFLPSRTDSAGKFFWKWVSQANRWFWGLGPGVRKHIVSHAERLLEWNAVRRSRIWRKRGFEGDCKTICRCVLACPILVVLFWFGLHVDARAMLSGLRLILPSVQSHRVGEIGSLYASAPPSSGSRSVETDQGAASQGPNPKQGWATLNHLFTWMKGIADYALSPFRELWHDADLGFMAIGLAAVQAALGLAFLWGIPSEESLANGPLEFFRRRPIPFSLFLFFDLGLGLLAGMRGFELGTGESIWIPAVISGIIGLVMPWIDAYMLHLFVECASDSLGIVLAIQLSALVLASASAAGVAWTAAVISSVLLACLAVILCNVSGGLVLAYLWTAEVFGEFVRNVYQWIVKEGDAGPKRIRTVRSGANELGVTT